MGVQCKQAFRGAIPIVIVEHDRSDMAVGNMDQDIVLRDNVVFNPAIAKDFRDL